MEESPAPNYQEIFKGFIGNPSLIQLHRCILKRILISQYASFHYAVLSIWIHVHTVYLCLLILYFS